MTKEEIKPSSRMILKDFLKLPERAQLLCVDYLNRNSWSDKNPIAMFDIIGFNYDMCESPIEVIFNMAFEMVQFEKEMCYELQPQIEIDLEDGKYRVDFMFDPSYEGNVEDAFPNGFKLIIECDGHDYHEKTKEQIAYNNVRDLELKKLGYDIIHFSGSQIYNAPLKCAHDALNYINIHRIDGGIL